MKNSRYLTQKLGLPLPADSPAGWQPAIFGPARGLADLPPTYYGHFFYNVLDGLATTQPAGFEANKSVRFLSEEPSRFGEVHPVEIDLAKPTLVTTNVQPFP